MATSSAHRGGIGDGGDGDQAAGAGGGAGGRPLLGGAPAGAIVEEAVDVGGDAAVGVAGDHAGDEGRARWALGVVASAGSAQEADDETGDNEQAVHASMLASREVDVASSVVDEIMGCADTGGVDDSGHFALGLRW